jgi:hypothetical protein
MTKYEGWTNKKTWNVALWIKNGRLLHGIAKEQGSYQNFVQWLADFDLFETPDGTKYNDKEIDVEQLNNDLFELRNE